MIDKAGEATGRQCTGSLKAFRVLEGWRVFIVLEGWRVFIVLEGLRTLEG